MRNGMRRWFVTLSLALGLGGCFDGEELTEGLPCLKNSDCGGSLLCKLNMAGLPVCGGEAAMEPVGNDPCEAGGNTCVDSNTLGVCNLADNSTMEVSCDMSCEQSGYAVSLGCHPSTGSKHQCYCDQGSAACTEPTCNSYGVFLDCSDNRLQALDCDGVCQGTGQVEYGCDSLHNPPCTCIAGTCSEGETFCQDDNTEVRCVGGVWQPQSCSDQACQQLQCPSEYNTCPEGYSAQTLGCGYDSNISNMGCRCTT